MNLPKKSPRKIAAVLSIQMVALTIVGLELTTGCSPSNQHPPATNFNLAATPPIAAAAEDLFEDVTAKAGINFVHQFCDSKIANILESNGAGGCWIDYDGDGWPDLFLVNSGPLDGVTHQPPGTTRQPNRLYHNKHDGTFEDVTEKAGLVGMGFCSAAIAGDYGYDF